MGCTTSDATPVALKTDSKSRSLQFDLVDDTISNNQVVVFSKTFCPFCIQAKRVLDRMDVRYKAVELDRKSDGAQIQVIIIELIELRKHSGLKLGNLQCQAYISAKSMLVGEMT